ncbi:MAG TPA: hypothetical protein VE175_05580 [Woeseiaceae bacterium]|jgi:LPS sulfotransferase NodH|nr:hypothetical protein [Woeseiaceae bacterium]
MVKFIVLSTQRSGSSYVCSLLDQHPAITCLEELFMPKNRNEITYRSYRSASLRRRMRHLLRRRQSIGIYLSGIYGEHSGIGARGFKLMYGQARRYPEVVEWCNAADVRVVHLIRRNALKTVVSRQVALMRGVYLSTGPVQPVSVTLDTRRLVPELERAGHLVEENRALFSSLPYVELSYEDFLVGQDEQVRRILSFLDCEENVQLSSELVKTSPDSLDKLIDNYEDVCRSLAGTPFEEYLEREANA